MLTSGQHQDAYGEGLHNQSLHYSEFFLNQAISYLPSSVLGSLCVCDLFNLLKKTLFGVQTLKPKHLKPSLHPQPQPPTALNPEP